jgi:hypothetical protein
VNPDDAARLTRDLLDLAHGHTFTAALAVVATIDHIIEDLLGELRSVPDGHRPEDTP